MKAHTSVRGCVSSLCILGGDHGIGAFHLPPRTMGRKQRKQKELSKFHSELKQDDESQNHMGA